MKLSKSVIIIKIAGKCCILPVGQRVIDSTSIMYTNSCGEMILEALADEQTEEQLAEIMFKKFDAVTDEDKTICRTDLATFLNDLRNAGILAE